MLAEVRGVTMRCGYAPPPGSQEAPTGRPVGKTRQEARASQASRGQGSGSFQGSAKPGPGCLLSPLRGGAGRVGPPGTHTPPQAVTDVWGEVGRNLGASLKKYFIGEKNVKNIRTIFVLITY